MSYLHAQTHMYMQHMHTHTCILTHLRTYIHVHIHTFLYTYTHIYKHTHTYIHTQIWDKDTLKLLKTLTGHKGLVGCLQFTGDILVSGSYDNSAKLVQLSQSNHACMPESKQLLHLLGV